jgi:Family of unknown function (DUF5681)
MTFQPGQSGNPAGRPRGSRNKKTLLLLALLRKVLGMGKVGGDPAMRRYVERILVPPTPKRIAARRRRRPSRQLAALQGGKKGGRACKEQANYKRADGAAQRE